MNDVLFDVLVVGGGHAGLSISYHLKQHKLNHIVFEDGKIGNSWLFQRWDSFKLVTPNKVNLLPGEENELLDPDGFCSAIEFAKFLENYARRHDLPIKEQCKVVAIERISESGTFSVSVFENGGIKKYRSKQVVIASGSQNKKITPPFAENISSDIMQLHTSEYKSTSLLSSGAVLVVGSAQSGIQVADDLIDAGRKVFLSTSQVGRIPRIYRHKDIVDWLNIIGFYDVQTENIAEMSIFQNKQPQVSGVGPRGRTLSLQALAKSGAVILGKVDSIKEDIVLLKSNAAANVFFGDEFSKKIKNMIDDYIEKSELSYPLAELDGADLPDDKASCASNITSINLRENNITSIIWATGFSSDFSYIKLPVFNDDGSLKHRNGVSEVKGLYFLGLPWLSKRKSGIILGIREDAEFIAQKILELR